ncbi:unnamed protein product [Durusdinium trenchii]|uniref:Glycosyl transferase family 1 domain-containing protein n=1 Tax=Durusdinium trenchii TaxID=1381693 RepID=A0ABP0KEB7_9DINO
MAMFRRYKCFALWLMLLVLFNMWTSFFPSWLPSDDVPDVSIPVGRDQHQSLEHSTQESLERSLNASSTQNSPAFSQEATLEHPGSHPGRLGTSIIYLFAQGQRSPREAARCTARLELHLQLLESTCRKNQPYKSIYQHWFLLGPGSRSALLDRLPQICDQRSHEVRRAARWPTPSELRGEHVVLVSSQVEGPFLPKFYAGAGLQFWSDAYTRRLRLPEVSLVANSIDCTRGREEIRFPLAMDRSFLSYAQDPASLLQFSTWELLDRPGSFQRFRRWNWTFCEATSSKKGEATSLEQHPYETLFVAEPVRDWPYFYRDLSVRMAKQEVSRPIAGRTLVVVAFFEKTPEYRDNMIFFLQIAIVPDSRSNAPVDYVIVVNGECTIDFPELKNLQVIRQRNVCYDFGSWGIGLQRRVDSVHEAFVVLNPTVRGPFLPRWYTQHWTWAFLSMLTSKVKLVGTSMNCPDGKGRSLVHVMSMIMAFDQVALDIAQANGIFKCAENKTEAMYREGDFLRVLRARGYSAEAFQASHSGEEWFRLPKKALNSPKPLRGKKGCPTLPNDVFFSAQRYFNRTAHPVEFVFFKTTRHMERADQMLTTFSKKLSQETAAMMADPKLIVMLSHSLRLDGAPMVLLELGKIFRDEGLQVHLLSGDDGPLRPEFEKEQMAVSIVKDIDIYRHSENITTTLLDFLGSFFWSRPPELVICNTIVWARALGRLPLLRPSRPRVVWFIHEQEISLKSPGLQPGEFWWGKRFPELGQTQSRQRIIAGADAVVFPAQATRDLWAESEMGHTFHTFFNFLDLARIHQRAGAEAAGAYADVWSLTERRISPLRASVRAELGVAEETFVLVAVGTICQRKNQIALVQPGVLKILSASFRKWLILLVGADDSSPSKRKYLKKFESTEIGRKVRLIQFGPANLKYTAAADLQVSLSFQEVNPLNLLEAKILAVPVLTTPAGGSPEQMVADGIDGFALKDFRQSTFEDRLRRLLTPSNASADDARRALRRVGRAGRATALALFGARAARPRVKELLERLMEDPSSSRAEHGVGVEIMVQLTAEHEASWPRIHACLQQTLDALGEWNGVTSAPLADVFLTTSFNGSSLTGVESLRKHRATRRLLTWQPEAFRSRGGQFLQQVLLARQMRLQHALLVRLQGNSFCRGKEQVLSILRLFHERPDVGMVVSMGENEMIGDRTELNWSCCMKYGCPFGLEQVRQVCSHLWQA